MFCGIASWPEHCIIGSNGAAFHPNLETDDANIIVRKGSDSAVDVIPHSLKTTIKRPQVCMDIFKPLASTSILQDLRQLRSIFCFDAAKLGYKLESFGPLARH